MTLQDAKLFQSALKAFNARKLSQARMMCDNLIARNRKDVNALDLRGQIALAYGHFDEAESYLLKCAKLRPREARAHMVLGEIYATQGRTREALGKHHAPVTAEWFAIETAYMAVQFSLIGIAFALIHRSRTN